MFARTPRLTLRPGWPEDAPALHAAIAHEAVLCRLAQAPWPYDMDDAAAFLATARRTTDVALLIWSHDAPKPWLVGGVGLIAAPDMHELGYWLTPSAWGRGYATEAARAVIAIARHTLALPRLAAVHEVDNFASARVLTKLGFREVDRARRYYHGRGGSVECAMHELDLQEHRAMPLAA